MKLIQKLDKALKCKALNNADKDQIKPVLNLLKALHQLGMRPDTQQQTVIAMRVKSFADVLDYVGESCLSTDIILARYEL